MKENCKYVYACVLPTHKHSKRVDEMCAYVKPRVSLNESVYLGRALKLPQN